MNEYPSKRTKPMNLARRITAMTEQIKNASNGCKFNYDKPNRLAKRYFKIECDFHWSIKDGSCSQQVKQYYDDLQEELESIRSAVNEPCQNRKKHRTKHRIAKMFKIIEQTKKDVQAEISRLVDKFQSPNNQSETTLH